MSEKYNITARKGDKRIYKPILQGRPWTEHEYYGKKCVIVQQGYIYDVHGIHVFGEPEKINAWATGEELVKI